MVSILDNSATAMTGLQPHPSTGHTARDGELEPATRAVNGATNSKKEMPPNPRTREHHPQLAEAHPG